MNPRVSRKWAGFLLITLVVGTFLTPYSIFFEKSVASGAEIPTGPISITNLSSELRAYTGNYDTEFIGDNHWPLDGCDEVYSFNCLTYPGALDALGFDEDATPSPTLELSAEITGITGDAFDLTVRITENHMEFTDPGNFDDMQFGVWIKKFDEDFAYDSPRLSSDGMPKIDVYKEEEGNTSFTLHVDSLDKNSSYSLAFFGAYDVSDVDGNNGPDGGTPMYVFEKITTSDQDVVDDKGDYDDVPNATFTTSDIGDQWFCWAWNEGLSLSGCLLTLYANTVYPLSSGILYVTGKFFDGMANWSLSSIMYQQSITDSDGEVTDTLVGTGWKLVRDFSNIFFILILVYLSISIILGIENAHAKKSIATVVVVALLINFSLLFCQIVLDSSNILARVFYNQIKVTGTLDSGISASDLPEVALSEAIAEGFNVQNIVGDSKTMSSLKQGTTKFGIHAMLFLMYVMGTVVNLAAAWVFFTVGIQFALRIVNVWFSMIFAPFAFFTNTNHKLKHLKVFGWDNWLKNFLCWCFFAPLFLFFIFLIMQLIQADFLAIILSAQKLENDFFLRMTGIMLQFVIIIIMLWKAKDIAKELGCEGAEMATKAIAGAALGAATGGAAFAMRQTVGRAGSVIQNSETLKRMQASGGVLGSLAKGTRSVGRYGAKQSFDLRNTGYGKAALGATGVKTGSVLFGKDAGKGGVAGIAERKHHKKIKKMREELKGMDSKETDESTKKRTTKKQEAWDKNPENIKKRKAAMADAANKKGKSLTPKELGEFREDFNKKNGRPPIYETTADANTARKKAYLEKMVHRGEEGGGMEKPFPGSPGKFSRKGQAKEAANVAQFWRTGSRSSEIEATEQLQKESSKAGSYEGAIARDEDEAKRLEDINNTLKTGFAALKNKKDPSVGGFTDHIDKALSENLAQSQMLEHDIEGLKIGNDKNALIQKNSEKMKVDRMVKDLKNIKEGKIQDLREKNQNRKDKVDRIGKDDKKKDKHDDDHEDHKPKTPKGGGGGGASTAH